MAITSFVDVVDVELAGRHAAGDDLRDDVGRLVAQWCDRAVVGRRQAVQFVLHDAGLLVVLGVPGGERRNHRAQPLCEARGGVVGSFQRGQQAAVALQSDRIEQLLLGAIVRVHGRRAHVETLGDLPRGAAAIARLREGLDRGPPHAFRRS